MGIFDKLGGDKDFDPNCELMDDGRYYCKPMLKEGDKVFNAEAIIAPTKTGNFKIVKFKGSARILPHLEKHFQELKLNE